VNPLHPEVNMLNLSQMERIMKQADLMEKVARQATEAFRPMMEIVERQADFMAPLMKEVAEQEAQISKMVSP